MMGELWKAAAEQVRLATMDETMGAEIVNEHFDEMKERLKMSSERAGYRDVSGGPIPPLEEEREEVEDEEILDAGPSTVEHEGLESGRPRPRLGESEEPAPERPEVSAENVAVEESSSSSSTSSSSSDSDAPATRNASGLG